MKIRSLLIVLAALLLVPNITLAADRAQELQERFKQRYPQLLQLKQAGTVGESHTGYIEFVKGEGDAEARQLVNEENADRTELYKLLAEREGTTPQKVAEVNARRNFERARPGEWLKHPDGQWKQKTQ